MQYVDRSCVLQFSRSAKCCCRFCALVFRLVSGFLVFLVLASRFRGFRDYYFPVSNVRVLKADVYRYLFSATFDLVYFCAVFRCTTNYSQVVVSKEIFVEHF